VENVEGAAPEPQEPGAEEVDGRFLEVEPFQQVEDPQRDERDDREPQSSAPAAVEVVGADEKSDRGRDDQRMEEVELGDPSDLEE